MSKSNGFENALKAIVGSGVAVPLLALAAEFPAVFGIIVAGGVVTILFHKYTKTIHKAILRIIEVGMSISTNVQLNECGRKMIDGQYNLKISRPGF